MKPEILMPVATIAAALIRNTPTKAPKAAILEAHQAFQEAQKEWAQSRPPTKIDPKSLPKRLP